jgi:hypothetical protein
MKNHLLLQPKHRDAFLKIKNQKTRFKNKENFICSGRAQLVKKIEDIFQQTALGLIDFCISVLFTGHGGELFILNVKYFCEESACGHEFAGFILGMTAFEAAEMQRGHDMASPSESIYGTRMDAVYEVPAWRGIYKNPRFFRITMPMVMVKVAPRVLMSTIFPASLLLPPIASAIT